MNSRRQLLSDVSPAPLGAGGAGSPLSSWVFEMERSRSVKSVWPTNSAMALIMKMPCGHKSIGFSSKCP